MRRAILYATLLLMTGTALAATTDKDSLYEIEVVVFENRHAPASGESGPVGKNAAPIPGLDNAIAPVAPATGGYKLSTAPLEKDGRYRVLSHQRWIQPMDSKAAVKARRISAGSELDGLVRVYMSRYLHADVQLVLKDGPVTGGVVHRIDEQRRVKNQEVHYYDHPRLGVLLLVSALEKDSAGPLR
jgi:hypothetical protein